MFSFRSRRIFSVSQEMTIRCVNFGMQAYACRKIWLLGSHDSWLRIDIWVNILHVCSWIIFSNTLRPYFDSLLFVTVSCHLKCMYHGYVWSVFSQFRLLTCLMISSRGIYPSDILPSQLTAFNGMNNTSGDHIIGEIRDSFKRLIAGYTRIIRLWRWISLVVPC